jgi:hypothetical protein
MKIPGSNISSSISVQPPEARRAADRLERDARVQDLYERDSAQGDQPVREPRSRGSDEIRNALLRVQRMAAEDRFSPAVSAYLSVERNSLAEYGEGELVGIDIRV